MRLFLAVRWVINGRTETGKAYLEEYRAIVKESGMTVDIEPEVPRLFWSKCGQMITAVFRDVKCLYLALRHPDTPWYAKMVLFLPVAYVCSPIQLIPSFIPVIGQLDDLFVLWIANKLLERLVSKDTLRECREAAAGGLKINPASMNSWQVDQPGEV
jgi:uncharacterized membrane protein YkvA (DUF1232 family)